MATALLATGCQLLGDPHVDYRDALVEGYGWKQVFRYEGTFRAEPNKDQIAQLMCDYEVECDPGSAGTLVLEGAPVAVTCEGNALSFEFFGSDGNAETDPLHWVCEPGDFTPSAPKQISAGWWGVYEIQMDSISLSEELAPGEIREGAWDIRFLVWAGPWKQPLCDRTGSGTPHGSWSSCVYSDSKEFRMTHRTGA